MEPSRAKTDIDLASGQLSALLKRHMPEVVTSVHLVGSAVGGDFQPGLSDLDVVGVLARSPTSDDIEGLAIVHRLYAADPTLAPLDGIWVTEDDLAAGPDAASDGPTSSGNRLIGSARGNRNPVTWFMLADLSRPLFGELDRTRLWRDSARLATWSGENAAGYWTGWLTHAENLMSREGRALLGRKATTWGVLGISRLHVTCTAGRIVSKSAAGAHAVATFDPRWRKIVEDCLRYRNRQGSLYANPLVRRNDALGFMRMAIAAIAAA